MSELITRRTFLKASGAAVVAAAGGMLAGCGDAYASTPAGLVALPIGNDTLADFDSFTADLGPFSEWTSSSIYDGGERHNYLYAAFNVNNVNGQAPVTITTNNFKFSHTGGGTGTIKGLGYKGLNDGKTSYVFNTSLTVDCAGQRTVVLFIDLGPISSSSFSKFYQGQIKITLGNLGTSKKTATFTYTGLLNDPDCTVA